jgi:hypothetical protein
MEPATERQIAYIKHLGGDLPAGLSKSDASTLIDQLLKVSRERERELREQEMSVPPSRQLGDLILELGGEVPGTTKEARRLINLLVKTAPAVGSQKAQALALGSVVPDHATYKEAEDLITALEKDADKEEGKPPSPRQVELVKRLNGDAAKAVNKWRTEEYIEELKKAATKRVKGPEKEALMNTLDAMERDLDEEEGAPPDKDQLKQILKLGGDTKSTKAANYWRAEEYIEELESKLDDAADRIADAFDCFYSDRDDSARMAVKKPSKSVMGKALKFGDSQGWAVGWDSFGVEDSPFMVEAAIYAIAPNLLKPGNEPPAILPQWSKKNSETPAPESVQVETMACPHCNYAILISSLMDGENKCWACKSTFKVQFE